MRMNITIEGKQSDMDFNAQQRTKRCLKVLQDIGFDIRIDFSDRSDRELYEYFKPQITSKPLISLNC